MILPLLVEPPCLLLYWPPLLRVGAGFPRQAPTNSPAKPSPGCGKCSEATSPGFREDILTMPGMIIG